MAKKIRKVFRRSYDKLDTGDYAINSDNLNPLRDSDLDKEVQEILNECQNRILKIKNKYNLEGGPDDSFDLDNPTIEGMNNQLDDMLNRLSKNPLWNLSKMGIDPSSLVGSSALEDLGRPLQIDCLGVDTLSATKTGELTIGFLGGTSGSSGTSSATAGEEGADSDYEGDLDKEFKITYNLMGAIFPDASAVATWPKTYTMRNPKFDLFPDVAFSGGKEFKGWYLDASFSEKVVKNKFLGYGRDVTLFALGRTPEEDEDSADSDLPEDNPANDDPLEELNCAIQEMEWIKAILAVCKVIKTIVDVVLLILSIIVPLINIVKEAVLAWVNPSNIASIINRVAQKLLAIVFSVIAALIMKLWSLLNFDCISQAASDTLAQIGELLSGISSVFTSLDEVALATDDVKNGVDWKNLWPDISKSYQDAWKNMTDKDEWAKQLGSVVDNLDDEALAAAGISKEDLKDENGDIDYMKLLNPSILYNSNIFPAEIRDTVSGLISQYKESEDTVLNMISTTQHMANTFMGLANPTVPAGTTSSETNPAEVTTETVPKAPDEKGSKIKDSTKSCDSLREQRAAQKNAAAAAAAEGGTE